MSNIGLPDELKTDIRMYFKKVQDTMSQQNELNEFFEQISPSLKLEVQSHMFERSINYNKTIKLTKLKILANKSKAAQQLKK